MSLPLLPIAQTANDWMTIWLTPIWYLAAGTALGLLALLLLILVFKALSAIPAWANLGSSAAGHVVAGIVTLLMSAGLWFLMPQGMLGDSALREPFLLTTALVLVCSVFGWALVFCSSKKASKNLTNVLLEGAPGYLAATGGVIILVGLAAWGIGLAIRKPIVEDPMAGIASIPQLFLTGEQKIEFKVAGVADGDGPFVEVPLPIDFDLLSSLRVESDKTVILADAENSADFTQVPIRLTSSEFIGWTDRQKIEELPIPHDEGTALYVQNKEIDEATLTFIVVTKPPVPEAASLVITALAVVLIGLMALLQQSVAPRASAVAHATVKNELAQPLFLVLMLIGVVAVLLYEFLSFNTFGEDIKLLKDCGITTIMLLAAFQGIWSASSSISEEIEGKTALTVLSKPIQRRSFVIGKFLGIFWVLLLMFVILGTVELGAVAYKPLYDAREASVETPTWQACHAEMVLTVPGLAMAFMQSVVLTAISVALATRLPQLANLAICFAIYVVGNLTTALVSSTQQGFEIVKFVAQLIATIIPILEHFQLQAAIDSGRPITMSLLSGNLIYCLLYVGLAMFLALLLFEDRDLA